MLTTRNFICLMPSGKGPKMSSPHYAKGHDAIIEVRYSDGCLGTLLNYWHWSQTLTYALVLAYIFG